MKKKAEFFDNDDDLGNLLKVEFKGIECLYRPETTDFNCLKEVIQDSTYSNRNVPGGGFDVEEGESWIDLGGNVGAFGLYAHLKGAKVTSYEPDLINFAVMSANYENNDLFKKGFKIVNSAVSNKHEEYISFYKGRSEKDRYRYSILPNAYETVKMPNIHMSKVNFKGVDGLKLDIEGSEIGLLDDKLIPKGLKKFVMEYHITKDRDMFTFWDRIEYLKTIFKHVYTFPSLLERDRYIDNKYPFAFDKLVWARN